MLDVKNLTVQIKNGAPILNGVSLSVPIGTCIGLTGASGSGKTTLLKAILGMHSSNLEIPAGEILLETDNLLNRTAKERRKLCGAVLGIDSPKPHDGLFSPRKNRAANHRNIANTYRGLQKARGSPIS